MFNYEVTRENEKIILMSIPVYKEDVFSFQREEKNGYTSVRINTVPRVQELFLNQTTLDIMHMCNGVHSCNEILELLIAKYPEVPRNTLKNDLMKIVSLLGRFQMIDWTERNPFMAEYVTNIGRYSFELLDDTDIRAIISFLRENEEKLHWNNIMHEYRSYSELYIRDMLFNFTEDFFALKDGAEILGVISVKYNANIKSSVSSIGVLVGDESYIDNLLNGVVKYYNSHPVGGRISKIKVQMVITDDEKQKQKSEKMLDSLLRNGFVFENTSRKEYKGMDLENYSYFIPEVKNA